MVVEQRICEWGECTVDEHETCGVGCVPSAVERESEAESASDAGMSTVEYAVGTIVAAAFAAVLYKIVTGNSVVSGLTDLINSALHTSL